MEVYKNMNRLNYKPKNSDEAYSQLIDMIFGGRREVLDCISKEDFASLLPEMLGINFRPSNPERIRWTPKLKAELFISRLGIINEPPKSFNELGNYYGVCGERVRFVFRRILRQLMNPVRLRSIG